MLNPELRKQLAATWPAQDRPKILHPFYVVYHYEWADTAHVIGHDDLTIATNLCSELLGKGAKVGLVEEYPYEILQSWKEKEKAKKAKQ